MKKLFILLIAFISIGFTTINATSNVIYDGDSKSFVFVPNNDLFSNLKGMLPNQTKQQTIELKNTSEDTITIYLENSANQEDKLLDYFTFTITTKSDNKIIFTGNIKDFNTKQKLTTLKKNASEKLIVDLSVDKDLGNDYQDGRSEVVWTFMLESNKTTNTGDQSHLVEWVAVLGASSMILLMYSIKRKKQKNI